MFGLPGGGANLDVVGAALDRGLRFVLAHGENAAAIMASTHGLLTRAPTPVVVTRGPGATSVANGAAQATLDRYPLVVITDTVADAARHRVAHQRIDQRALFSPITKHTCRVGADASAELLGELAKAPTTWPFGAVHVDDDAAASTDGGGLQPVDHSETRDDRSTARSLIADAQHPVVIVGMEAAALGGAALSSALVAAGIPVLTTYQAIGVVPTESAVCAGLFTNGALEAPVLDAADLIIAIGLDTVEPIPAPWNRDVPIISVSTMPGDQSTADDLSPYFPQPDAEIHDDLAAIAGEILPPGVVDQTMWQADAGRQFRSAAQTAISGESSGAFGPTELVATAATALPPGVITTVDAGAHFLAVMPLWPVTQSFDLLISNGLATMGFALPAAIGAAVARPDTPVLALTGDGGLGMTLAEIETVVRLDLPITLLVFNDATLSLIKIKQQEQHGGSEVVGYGPTDFGALASASGMAGIVVESAAELADELAGRWDRPRLIDARIDPADYARLIAATRG